MEKLLFISHQTAEYSQLEGIQRVLEGGCKEVQLRMKGASMHEVEQMANQAKELCDAFDAHLYINDYPEVALRVDATGVHLGKSDGSPCEARKLLGAQATIGGTANTWEDIERLSQQSVDYIGLGPFRFTQTKTNLSPVLGLEGYRNLMEQCKIASIHQPIYAIGGITLDDIPALMETGIYGIALSSTILKANNPVVETRKIVELLKTYI